jgi:lipopolysaccharide export system permease protein
METPKMNRLSRYLLGQFLFLFGLALAFFTLSIILSDLLVNLSKLVPLGVGFDKILLLSMLFVPQAASWSLSPALLFAVAFVLGNLYAHNELVVVFGSGISLGQFVAPLFVVGVLASGLLFFWNDRGVIGAESQRQELNRSLQGLSSKNNSNVAFLSDSGRLLYSATFYNDQTRSLTGVVLVKKDLEGRFLWRVDADWADWALGYWTFHKVRTFTAEGTHVVYRYDDQWSDPAIADPPESFQKKNIEMNELTFGQALAYVQTLKRAGLPSAEPETDTYQRISFSFSPFVVIWISAALGGRFRKNILLMSLLVSLLVSASYIILQMVFGLLSKTDLLPPWLGAGAGVLAGTVAAAVLFFRART